MVVGVASVASVALVADLVAAFFTADASAAGTAMSGVPRRRARSPDARAAPAASASRVVVRRADEEAAAVLLAVVVVAVALVAGAFVADVLVPAVRFFGVAAISRSSR